MVLAPCACGCSALIAEKYQVQVWCCVLQKQIIIWGATLLFLLCYSYFTREHIPLGLAIPIGLFLIAYEQMLYLVLAVTFLVFY